MGENSAISWTHHTFNPWVGCTKISVGPQGACEHCYAEAWAKRSGLVKWGGPRRRTSESNWKLPLKWHASIPDGQRHRVFCASLADVFDNEVPEEWRYDLFQLIRKTPRLDWLLLTKRIGNAKGMLMEHGMEGAHNIWVGATVVTQAEADRDILKLLGVPARIRFLSIEPMMGPITLTRLVIATGEAMIPGFKHFNLTMNALRPTESLLLPALDWVIAGGESGTQARPIHPDWVRSLRDQCVSAGVAWHFKQWGEWLPFDHRSPSITISGLTGGIEVHTDGRVLREKRVIGWQALNDHRLEAVSARVGTKIAGRLLDGLVWDEFPKAAA